MLQLRTDQMKALARGSQDAFLCKLARHLNATIRAQEPGTAIDYASPAMMDHLRADLHLLLEHGINDEFSLAAAIEMLELYGAKQRESEVRAVLERRQVSVQQRLDGLWALTRWEGGDAQHLQR